jgi:hypothetical protein
MNPIPKTEYRKKKKIVVADQTGPLKPTGRSPLEYIHRLHPPINLGVQKL